MFVSLSCQCGTNMKLLSIEIKSLFTDTKTAETIRAQIIKLIVEILKKS